MLGVPVLKADCRSLVHRRPPRSYPRCTIFFDTGVSRSHRTLLSSLYASSLFCLDISSSHRLFLSDPTIRVYFCDTAVTVALFIHSHRPHFHSSRFPFSHPAGPPRTQYISRKPHASHVFSRAQVIRYPSFSPSPTIFIHSNPKPEQCGSFLMKKTLPPFLVVVRDAFLRLGPVDRVCGPPSRPFTAPWVASRGLVSYPSLIFALPLLASQAQRSPSRLSPRPSFTFLPNGRHPFLYAVCHADFCCHLISWFLKPLLRDPLHIYNTPQMLFHVSSIRRHLLRPPLIPSSL
jgi:hypothetical protein